MTQPTNQGETETFSEGPARTLADRGGRKAWAMMSSDSTSEDYSRNPLWAEAVERARKEFFGVDLEEECQGSAVRARAKEIVGQFLQRQGRKLR
jgi:hypothetical protein